MLKWDVRKIAFLCLTGVLVLASFQVYQAMLDWSQAYYGRVAVSSRIFPRAMFGVDCVWYEMKGSHELIHGDVERFIDALSEHPSTRVERTDSARYTGSVAVAGFLDFVLVYLLFVAIGLALHRVAPPALRKSLLTAWSASFLFVALPEMAAFYLLDFAILVLVVWLLPIPPRARAALLTLVTVGFYVEGGSMIVQLCVDQFSNAARLPWTAAFDGPLNAVLRGLHLGQLNGRPDFHNGIPCLYVALGSLMKLFRRLCWLIYETWHGENPGGGAEDLILYLVGLPWLTGESASPSFSAFVRSARLPGRGPGDDGRSVALCLGLCTLGYVFLAMLGTSPAARFLFGGTSLATAGPLAAWVRIVSMFALQYLYMLATSQASIGVCRLFGWQLGDNFRNPLLARDAADFWRRWNIHWRQFLLRAFYFPTVLALARRKGRQTAAHIVVAVGLTFTASFALNVAPLAMLTSEPVAWHPLLIRNDPSPSIENVEWRRIAPSLALFNAVEAALVAGSLIGGLRRRRRWAFPLGTVATIALMAAARTLLDTSLTLAEQLRLLAHAVGWRT
jgi:hypothetical protein